jgi:ferredoxin
MAIAKVWIEEGCIVCNACETDCPDVFLVTDTTCVIRGNVRVDGVESENREEMAELMEEHGTNLEHEIEAAAAGCPVEVIKYEKR